MLDFQWKLVLRLILIILSKLESSVPALGAERIEVDKLKTDLENELNK